MCSGIGIGLPNGAWFSKGTRINLGWNSNVVDVNVVSLDDQAMHTRVWIKAEKKEVFCSFVYAHNRYIHRRALWQNLGMHKCYFRNRPWCIMGDFNAALNLEDMSVGSSNIDISMREFKEYVEDIEVTDVPRSGLQFTWNQKPKGCDGILKKIDQVMANLEFSDVFVGAYALFQPYRISDHSLTVLKIPMHVRADPKPFKFPNILTLNDRFKQVVQDGWAIHVSSFFMFRVVRKHKLLKCPFRKLPFEKGNLHENVKKLSLELDRVQVDLDSDLMLSFMRRRRSMFKLITMLFLWRNYF
ncbi:RNA-directed DNA polymerase, eukaryota, reverse transcriptase zinc-binding domain protein [Tanacetum coccineum]|uniref:RNA-directed DNA polymerase, eukaryota, reverse transcriptase zinc-binding domain protein n=1 Tax=Tanacetum coccineum TaxID=301880 RepID=A0ABQ5E399_9ASTR